MLVDAVRHGKPHLTRLRRKAPPFQYGESYDASPTDPNALTMTDPYPASQISSAVFSVPSIDPGFREAYIQQWNLGYQQEFARNMVFEVSYAGSKGTRMFKNIDYNQAVPGLTALQSRRPYPEYGSISVLGNRGFSTYDLSRSGKIFSFHPPKNIRPPSLWEVAKN